MLDQFTIEDLDLEDARRHFWNFRKLMDPKMIEGWWQKEISSELQNFIVDLIAGKRPKLVIQSPPQHGKSSQIVDLVGWAVGKHPHLRTIYGSYSERLGVRANLKLQRMFASKRYQQIFPDFKLSDKNVNREMIEYANHEGFFRNTTVRGSVTGESLDFGIIDDPIKGRAEANSEVTREATWDWFTDDFFSRFSDEAGLLIVLTRWHVDDPVGRMLEKFPDLRIISYPAIATQDEEHRKFGEALFPELKPIDFLLERKSLMAPSNWESLYQQNPTVADGEMFTTEMFSSGPVPEKQDYSYITVDTAYKDKETNDFHVFMAAKVVGEQIFVEKIYRKRIKANESQAALTPFIKTFVAHGFRGAYIEPKGHGIYLNQELPKDRELLMPTEKLVEKFYDDRALSKVERANNVLPHMTGRKIIFSDKIPEKDMEEIMQEILAFPNAKHDDVVDCLVDMIKLVYSGKAIPTMNLVSMTGQSKWIGRH